MKNERQFYSKEVYPISAIMQAIQDYKRVSTIEVSEEGDNYCCTFTRSVVDRTRVVHEFDNYLIELLNSHDTSSLL